MNKILSLLAALSLSCQATTLDLGHPDASVPVEAGPDASRPPTPTALLWLEADYGTAAGALSSWSDQSGSGNDATQSEPASQPTLVANQANGLPVVRFDGTSFLALPSGFKDFTAGLSAFAIVRAARTTQIRDKAARIFDFAAAYGDLNDAILFVRYWPNNEDELMFQIYSGVSPGTNVAAGAFTDDVWEELAVVKAASPDATATLYKNGLEKARSIVNEPRVITRKSNWIGKSNYVTTPPNDPLFRGDIAALIVFAVALSDDDRIAMDRYLQHKWGIVP